MHLLLFASLTILPLLAQVRVLSPTSLQKVFQEDGALATPNGVIPASTATFGSPKYGESFVGRLLKIDSMSCNPDYNSFLKENYNITVGAVREDSHGLRDIFLIPRGQCSFVRKVAVAQQSGADAVIITDREDSPWDRRQIAQVILADDGNGLRVNIPSVLVEKNDGKMLASANFSRPPLVTMEWSLPQKDVVQADFWTTSGSPEATVFLSQLSPYISKLKDSVNFRTHYYVLRMESSIDAEATQQLCYKSDAGLCVPPAPPNVPLSGQDILQENLRELCLADLTSELVTPPNGDDASGGPYPYSAKWWKYVELFPSRCRFPKGGATDVPADQVFGEKCSSKLLTEVGADPAAVMKCSTDDDKALSLLKREQNNNAWGVAALRVNGGRFSGNLDPLLVMQAICSAFESPPPDCSDIARLPPSASKTLPSSIIKGDNRSFWFRHIELIIYLLFGATLLSGMYLYQMYNRHGLRRALRHEVMLEVKSQLQDYYRVDEPSGLWAPTGGADTGGSTARETEFATMKFRV